MSRDISYERGIISTKDRQHTAVRYGLPAIQVLIFVAVLIAGVGPLLWLLKSGVSTSPSVFPVPVLAPVLVLSLDSVAVNGAS